MSARRTYRVGLSFTGAEMAELRAAADREALPLASWAAPLVLAAARREPGDPGADPGRTMHELHLVWAEFNEALASVPPSAGSAGTAALPEPLRTALRKLSAATVVLLREMQPPPA
ncbi:hypothetical protein [Streptomyces sp. NPDC097619]|uniref:hypothetical protein n=1 Tax=Streptomyces sp. NPDC097619 TaxID=3157228 RepID=UPI0033280057